MFISLNYIDLLFDICLIQLNEKGNLKIQYLE